ncbi:MAG: DoxX family protein [Pseudoxanthomonas sp.]|nr:DoxX family protein [Pseudoxanthomonas sp.]
MGNTALLVGRAGLALMFIVSGCMKIAGYAGTQGYMETAGLPGALLPAVIALELGGGLAILLGLYTRGIAIALALFCLASAALFHHDLADPNQFNHLLKNIAIAGGFIVLAAAGAGRFSVDAMKARRAG